MITKKQFTELMEKWKALETRFDEIDRALYDLCGASFGEVWWDWSGLVSDVMKAAMEDHNDWVSYFASEREFDLSKDCVYDPGGNVIPTSTWDEVYDMIVKENTDG